MYFLMENKRDSARLIEYIKNLFRYIPNNRAPYDHNIRIKPDTKQHYPDNSNSNIVEISSP